MMKASADRNAEYDGKVQLWFSANNPQERIMWDWLQQQKESGVKLAPLIKAILYQHITNSGQGGEVIPRLDEIKALVKKIATGQIAYGPEVEEEANDLLDTLGGIST